MARWGAWLAAPAGLALALAACAGEASADAVVTIDDRRLTLSVGALDEGAVQLDVDNVGSEEHELVIVADPGRGAEELPLGADGRVDLDAAVPLDRAGPFRPGRYRTGVPNLNAGAYIVLCNLPGHFARGLWARFDVETDDVPAPTASVGDQ